MPCTWNDSLWLHTLNSTTHPLEIPVEVTFMSCAPFTVIFNLMVLWIFTHNGDLRALPSQTFVCLMTLSDLAFGLVCLPSKAFVHCFPRWYCGFYYVVIWTSQILSIEALLFLNVDKFLSLAFPLRYHAWVTLRTARNQVMVAMAITLAFTLTTYFLNVYEVMEGGGYVITSLTECKLVINALYYLNMTIFCYIFPSLVSLTTSIYVFCLAQRLSKQGQSDSRVAKRIFFVFSATIWASVTFLPYRISYSGYAIFAMYWRERSEAMENLTWALCFLFPLGTVGNPLITIMTQRQYRDRFFRLGFAKKLHLKSICGCLDPLAQDDSQHQSVPDTSVEVFRLL